MTKINQSEFARVVGLPRSRVSELVRAGAIDLSQGLDASITEYCQDLRDKLSNRKQEAGSLTDHRTRHERAKADRAELELAARRGELLPTSAVIEMCSAGVTNCRNRLLALDKKLRNEFPGLPNEVFDRVYELHEDALEQLGKGGIPRGLEKRMQPLLKKYGCS